MKSLTNKLMVAAAAVAAAAGAASAQTMKVDVPFAFQVAGTEMPAGSYLVTPVSTSTNIPVLRMASTVAPKPVLVRPLSTHDQGVNPKNDAKLVFSCAGGNCSLAQIWAGTVGAYDLHYSKTSELKASLIAIPANRAD